MILCRLQALLDTRQLSRRAAARLTGLDRATVRKLACNEWAAVHHDTLQALCAGLHVTPADLLEYVPDAETPEPAPATD